MRIARFAALAVIRLLAALAVSACHAESSVPPELAGLEREVGLELAHVRDAGPTDPEKRRELAEAASLDSDAERAIRAGDYPMAEDKFLRARLILRQLEQ